MIKREQLINKLRALGYQFHKPTDRRFIYRKGTHRVFVPRSDLITDLATMEILHQCGCREDEVKIFIASCHC